ncbi:uncharacterized protein LOC120130015 [Hibiscus syriacus]|uniref:uncharacterized protein LOC120130015 n=1 Tax=Hibiscus syriacus TaxID=106335 RepID=UPI0019214545|nr:uncharacterized protein LOC120130015 [Hibiscus syriacus]
MGTNEAKTETCNFKQSEGFTSDADAKRIARDTTWLSNGSSNDLQKCDTTVSWLNPWQFAQQSLDTSLCYCHPLRHTAIVAIEASAARDRHSEKLYEVDSTPPSSSPAKRQRVTTLENDANTNGSNSLDRPYLCTGYDIYLVWEPCTMCAMALVHQRIRRISYALPNPEAGALVSVHRLQGEKSLNHHYAVFRVVMPELDFPEESSFDISYRFHLFTFSRKSFIIKYLASSVPKNTTFCNLIDKISSESRFWDALKSMKVAIERNEEPFQRMRWLQHLIRERENIEGHDWDRDLGSTGIKDISAVYVEHKGMAERYICCIVRRCYCKL